MQGFIQDFFLGGGGGGGDVHVVAAVVLVCKTPYLEMSGGMSPTPQGKFFNLQPLRQFLVAPETTYTV